MTIIGFNFTKINVEKKEGVKGKISIANNVTIKDVSQRDLNLGTEKQNALKFVFEFTSVYEPNLGNITLTGDVLYLADSKKAKDILDQWKKDKKIAKDIMSNILNMVLAKCNIEALILSQDVNLPPPIPLPKVTMKSAEHTE